MMRAMAIPLNSAASVAVAIPGPAWVREAIRSAAQKLVQNSIATPAVTPTIKNQNAGRYGSRSAGFASAVAVRFAPRPRSEERRGGRGARVRRLPGEGERAR